jgi:hypothetical protein
MHDTRVSKEAFCYTCVTVSLEFGAWGSLPAGSA